MKEYQHLEIKESLDLGHGEQEFKRKANTFVDFCARALKDKTKPQFKTLRAYRDVFSMSITHLIIWFKALVLRVVNKEKKENLWINTTQHLIGNHKGCKHPNDITDYQGPG